MSVLTDLLVERDGALATRNAWIEKAAKLRAKIRWDTLDGYDVELDPDQLSIARQAEGFLEAAKVAAARAERIEQEIERIAPGILLNPE